MASDSNSLTESPTEFEKPSTTWSSLTSWAASVTVRILTLVSALGNGTPKNVSTAVTASQVVILMTVSSNIQTCPNLANHISVLVLDYVHCPKYHDSSGVDYDRTPSAAKAHNVCSLVYHCSHRASFLAYCYDCVLCHDLKALRERGPRMHLSNI